jgi:flagellar protein FlaF
MAVAGIIGAAIGVMLLIIVAYVLVGSVLTSAEVITNAQKDITLLQGARLGTNIEITSHNITAANLWLNFNVTNTGNEVIADFEHTDVFIFSPPSIQHNIYEASENNPGKWRKMGIYYGSNFNDVEVIHPNQLDPGEKMWVCATYTGANPIWFQITTSNGVNAQTTI